MRGQGGFHAAMILVEPGQLLGAEKGRVRQLAIKGHQRQGAKLEPALTGLFHHNQILQIKSLLVEQPNHLPTYKHLHHLQVFLFGLNLLHHYNLHRLKLH